MRRQLIAVLLLCLAGSGCSQGSKPTSGQERKGVFGKTTQDIGLFDPNAPQQKVSDQKINATDPVTAPLSAYGPMVEKVSMIAVENAINLFYATEGRYPKDHAEFMEKIIRANDMKLPVLPYKGQYKYDEVQHALVVVYPEPPPANEKK